MNPIEPAKLLKAVYQAVNWERLYLIEPHATREDVDELFRAIGERLLAAAAARPTPKAAAPEKQSAKAASGSVDTIVINTDGASKGNPGPAGAGVALTTESGAPIDEISRYLGRMTNNQAEYEALRLGLQRARELGARRVIVRTDSELMAHQINGVYRVKNPGLKRVYDTVMDLLGAFDKWKVQHVRREKNSRADELANKGVREGKR